MEKDIWERSRGLFVQGSECYGEYRIDEIAETMTREMGKTFHRVFHSHKRYSLSS
jgi:hypothetical protein